MIEEGRSSFWKSVTPRRLSVQLFGFTLAMFALTEVSVSSNEAGAMMLASGGEAGRGATSSFNLSVLWPAGVSRGTTAEGEPTATAIMSGSTDDPQRLDAARSLFRHLGFDESSPLSHGMVAGEPAPVRPIDPGPTAAYLFLTGLAVLFGVVRCQQPVRRQDLGASGRAVAPVTATGSILVQVLSSDRRFAGLITEQLHRAGYEVEQAASVPDLLALERPHAPTLVLVDSRTTDWDIMRTDPRLKHVPLMIVVPDSAFYSEADVVADLERGADGVHLCREGLRLLVARVGAYLWRAGVQSAKRAQCRIGGIELDADLREIKIGGEPVPLSAKPFTLLAALMGAPSKVFSRKELASLLWGSGFAVGEHTLDVHIHAIRQKLNRDPLRRCRLVTIKGVGFKLIVESSESVEACQSTAPLVRAANGPAVPSGGWLAQGQRLAAKPVRTPNGCARPTVCRGKRMPLFREAAGRSLQEVAG